MEFEIDINETAGLKLFMKKQLGDNIREFQYSPQEYFILSVFYFSSFLHLCNINIHWIMADVSCCITCTVLNRLIKQRETLWLYFTANCM
jgi:hypothetical protein